MTRRDRAALVLAYECLRGGDQFGAASAVLAHGDALARELQRTAHRAWEDTGTRAVSIRLALLLRALLRADAGDFGRRVGLWCPRCERNALVWTGGEGRGCCVRCGAYPVRVAPMKPLWQLTRKASEGGGVMVTTRELLARAEQEEWDARDASLRGRPIFAEQRAHAARVLRELAAQAHEPGALESACEFLRGKLNGDRFVWDLREQSLADAIIATAKALGWKPAP